MKLIVGLGNPGNIFVGSRHNLGFKVVKRLAKVYKIVFKKDSNAHSLSAKFNIDEELVILAMPLMFMNLSGVVVKALLKKYKIDLNNLLVVCDDLDLEFGRLKIKPGGSSGGHRGLQSIIDCLGSDNFARLRLGIGKNTQKEASEFVLSRFTKTERKKIRGLLERAVECCQIWITEGISKSMNIFNQRFKE